MAKKRILIVIAGNNGTIGMCSRNLYLALKQQDTLEVKCVGIHHFENGIAELEDIEYYQPTGNFLTRNIGVLSQICWLRNVKKVFRPDITISTLFSTSVINVLSGECGKTIGIFHSPHQQLKVFGPINYFITLCNYTLVYPRLDKLACVSEEVKDSLAVFPFIPKKKVEVIYNVHNAALIRKMADMNLPTEEKDLLSHPYVLYCGRMDENKAPRRALEAFAKAHRPGDANIVYIGHEENGQLERLLQRAKELGISDKIHYLGKKANPYPYMRHARALISSSYSEGLPGVMIESLILGTPVITTNSSKGIWEIFSCTNRYQRELRDNFRNECGYITPNLSFKDPAQHDYDIDHLADAISSIWKSDKVEAFPFERKVSAEYIFNQYNNLPEMRLSRFIKKAVYTISKFFVVKLAYVDSRLYMEYYCKILKNSGLRGGYRVLLPVV